MNIQATQKEKVFDKNTLLVTKTDLKGIITYANRHFMNIVGLNEDGLIGKPHNIIRHPDMPKIIFQFLWEYIQDEREIHAYVKNICADGSFYWVLANVTPSFNFTTQKVIGYHSARRTPSEKALAIIIPLYKQLLLAEKKGGIQASQKIFNALLKEKGIQYDEFILSI